MHCFILSKLDLNDDPFIVIIDIDLGEENGFELVRVLKQKNNQIKTLMYSMHKESGYLLDAKSSGANGYISKDADIEEFQKCIDSLAAGNDYFSNSINSKSEELQAALKLLTPKEQQVFKEILKEENNESISKKLNISTHSVEIYVSRIYDKLGVHFRGDLISKYNKGL